MVKILHYVIAKVIIFLGPYLSLQIPPGIWNIIYPTKNIEPNKPIS